MPSNWLSKTVSVPVCIIFPFMVFCNIVAFNLLVLNKQNLSSEDLFTIDIAKKTVLDDESNVIIPKDKHGVELSIEERLRYLELKTNAFIGFGTNPFFGAKVQASLCKTMSTLKEFGCKLGWEGVNDANSECSGLFDHNVCIDNLPKPRTKLELNKKQNDPPCLIYDFGIRAQPQFGAVMARTFGCEVHGFDPSPVSTNWWKSDEANELRKLPNYHFHPYGAGGNDGDIVLKEYNWGQVSILRYPSYTVKCKEGSPNCDLEGRFSKDFRLPVKTLPTIMKELGHEGRSIDILKVDVEGSEYAFLEQLLDTNGGCPDFIKQMTLEWHHYSFDPRYGEGASPPINTIATLLNSCGLKNIWQ